MAASSTDDIPTQLAALLGKRAVQVRKTDETPPRISVIDVATLCHRQKYEERGGRRWICSRSAP